MRAHCPLPIVLASASPRRRQILSDAGYRFEVRDPGDAENTLTSATTPENLAIAKARLKAQTVAQDMRDGAPTLVIGADTLVAIRNEIIGKPQNRLDAERILARLSGTRHRVITGLCLWLAPQNPRSEQVAETSWLVMHPLSKEDIAAYVASGESDGKAGAYSVQESGDRFVERIEGSFLNVVGFPLERFEQVLPLALQRWGMYCKDIHAVSRKPSGKRGGRST